MTNDQLKNERDRRGFNQPEMAAHLKTPVSTYRKWEQGLRKVPSWVETSLAPTQTIIPGLSMAEINELDQLARKQGRTMQDLVGDFIRTRLPVAVIVGGMEMIHRSPR